MTHARRGHLCDLCGETVFGNGGAVSHGRKHVRRGEAVELVKDYSSTALNRVFLAVENAAQIEKFEGMGYLRASQD